MDLSIIIPVYNGEEYLKECLASIVPFIKESSKIELIIIDDGSTDSSLEICEKYKCENMTIIKNTNHGVSYSRNIGLKLAKRKFYNVC